MKQNTATCEGSSVEIFTSLIPRPSSERSKWWKFTLQNVLIIAEPSAEPKLTRTLLVFKLVFTIFYNEAKRGHL